MSLEKDEDGHLLDDEYRLNKYGRFIRKTSLDELPELFNILIGNMSIVGPRPLLVEYLDRYDNFQMRRHEVRPGLTGYAQINGRNLVSWKKRFEFDVYYVDHISFFFDITIIFKSVFVVISKKGIHSENNETMEEFRGN